MGELTLSGRDPVIATSVLVAGALISWERLPTLTRSTLWAEDGWVFLNQALNRGPVASLLTPYAGYVHTVPRLLADLTVAAAPMRSWALVIAALACVVTAGIAALVYLGARTVIPGVLPRLGLAGITVFLPQSAREVLGNVANLHWYFLWLAPWLLLHIPTRRWAAWALGAVALLAALTEIQIVVFLPLLAFRWRDRRTLPIRAALLAGLAAQLVATVLSPRRHHAGPSLDAASITYGFLINTSMATWIAGSRNIGTILLACGPLAGVSSALPILVALVWIVLHGSRRIRLLAAMFMTASVLLWVTAVETTPLPSYEYAHLSPYQAANPWLTRYGVVPALCQLAVILMALTVQSVRPSAVTVSTAWRSRLVRAAAVAVMTAVIATQTVPTSTRRDHGPALAPQVTALRARCLAHPSSAVFVLHGAPRSRWGVHVTCGELTPLQPKVPGHVHLPASRAGEVARN